MPLRGFEQHALSLLIPGGLLAPEILSAAEVVSLHHTGNGYFLTLKHPAWPQPRTVFHEPFVVGDSDSLSVGFVAYVEKNELTLECHGMGTEVPLDVRDRDFRISIARATP